MSKRERVDMVGDQQKKYKNCFVKNLGLELSNENLMEAFSKYGPITSCVIMTDEDGKSKGFGFVAFEDHEDAEKVSQSVSKFLGGSGKYRNGFLLGLNFPIILASRHWEPSKLFVSISYSSQINILLKSTFYIL